MAGIREELEKLGQKLRDWLAALEESLQPEPALVPVPVREGRRRHK